LVPDPLVWLTNVYWGAHAASKSAAMQATILRNLKAGNRVTAGFSQNLNKAQCPNRTTETDRIRRELNFHPNGFVY